MTDTSIVYLKTENLFLDVKTSVTAVTDSNGVAKIDFSKVGNGLYLVNVGFPFFTDRYGSYLCNKTSSQLAGLTLGDSQIA